mmetsp:Transcript_57550/g.136888  ORF Transcript_57550/g.136888 Transcript_57550/m.136888 type:complete len:253 (+) Transcript_57550:104-862(+)|eukprot:CAMPEP_0178422534 /NCGR_PEP_ID=MMETSP0689_2-20121128/27225_1 /TAXON_ID=160604 /ORGANISM="Amphidinium massartii, Strain CS-259" /LENGTH=252 /DNA_ID=CAMNT_0020044105 /DNA_START=56 /DNA_END=814 /DNA_ORIENTATION=+
MASGPVVVFGGRGMVGAAICRELVRRGVTPVIAASRSAGEGAGGPIDEAVVQKSGVDALKPETLAPVLAGAKGVVISIGLPPWIRDKDLAKQMNGITNVNILRAAAEQKVPRVVLVNATMPSWSLISGYREGKELAEQEALNYPATAGQPDAGVLILKPGGIAGTRYDIVAGRGVPLGAMMVPARVLLKLFAYPCSLVEKWLPSCFGGVLRPPVYVEEMAVAAADALGDSAAKGVTTLGPEKLVGYVPSTTS